MLVIEEICFTLPPTIVLPFIVADTPLPVSDLKSVVSRAFILLSIAFCTTAFARGCSLLLSSEEA